jgi:hypothetical protein
MDVFGNIFNDFSQEFGETFCNYIALDLKMGNFKPSS